MKSAFETYLNLGFDHILDPNGYDHILFIVALCAIYTIKEWKKVAILATAFTVGHSITLALSALDILRFPSNIIEFLIPVTIFLTAIYNVISKKENAEQQKRLMRLNYLFALLFGLIHGMGFSNFFRSSLLLGEDSNFLSQLLAFNIGVELGQLVIVGVILGVSWIIFNIGKAKQREWVLFVSGATAGVALILMMDTKFW